MTLFHRVTTDLMTWTPLEGAFRMGRGNLHIFFVHFTFHFSSFDFVRRTNIRYLQWQDKTYRSIHHYCGTKNTLKTDLMTSLFLDLRFALLSQLQQQLNPVITNRFRACAAFSLLWRQPYSRPNISNRSNGYSNSPTVHRSAIC